MGKIRHRKKRNRNRGATTGRSDSPVALVDSGPENEEAVSENGERKKDGNQFERDRGSNGLRRGSGIELLPLLRTPDGWNLNHTFLRNVVKQMQSEGTLEVLFCDAKVDSEEAFLKVFANSTNLAVFAFKDSQQVVGQGDLAAMAWLNQMQHDHAQAHYWFAKKVWGASALTVGKEILDYWFRFIDKDSGEPLFKVIVGQTPSGNRRSVAFNKRLGFTFVGTIPKVYKGGVDIYFLENPYGKE